jgi:hypothetical protein
MIDHYRSDFGALNCPVLCRLRGPLDSSALNAAINDLSRRHESLRTTFAGRGRGLTQVVHEVWPLELAVVDLSREDHPESAARDAISEELQTRIDVQTRSLRATLWRVGDVDHVLCINMNHLVTDAWSCGVLFQELSRLLDRRCGATVKLPPVGWQYRQFVDWQQRLFEGDEFRLHHGYWQRQLTDVQLPDLPSRPAPAAFSAKGGAIAEAEIDALAVEALRRVARNQRTTLFAVMLSVYYVLLYRLTGQCDLAVASLFANRSRREVQGTVGFLANMVLLRARFREGSSFADVISETHRTVIGALAHQELPYHMLRVDTALMNARRPDDVVFQVMPDPGHRATSAGIDFELMVPHEIGRRFRFELVLAPKGGGFAVLLFYGRDRFDCAWVERLVSDYSALARALAVAPDSPISAHPL